jgi:hypothetical protein
VGLAQAFYAGYTAGEISVLKITHRATHTQPTKFIKYFPFSNVALDINGFENWRKYFLALAKVKLFVEKICGMLMQSFARLCFSYEQIREPFDDKKKSLQFL